MRFLQQRKNMSMTYHWERNRPVGHEVVVQAGQVGAATSDKLNGDLEVGAQLPLAVLDGGEHLLVLLLQQLLLHGQVLDYGGRILDGGEGGDVVQRRVVGERSGRRSREEGLVSRAERHDGARSRARKFGCFRVGEYVG